MNLSTLSWFFSWFGGIVVFLLILGYVNFKLNSRYYWKRRNVPHHDPTFLVGNFRQVNISKTFGQVVDDIYFRTKSSPLVGAWLYIKPLLVVNDLGLIKNILVRDFQHFHDRGSVYDEELEPLSAHLFNMNGAQWRNLRVKLTPTFTSGKMKIMFPTIAECGRELQDYLAKPAMGKETIEVKDILARFTTDVISSCAFGIQTNSLQNPDAEFRRHGKLLFKPDLWQVFIIFFAFAFPPLIKYLPIRQIPVESGNFFMNAVKETIATREKNNIKRNDFMDLLIQLLRKGRVDDADHHATEPAAGEKDAQGDKFTINQAAAQAFVFFLAGFETSSTTMVFTLYELAKNPDLRTRCQKEIDEVMQKHGGQLTYDSIQEMQYLDCVVNETLRMYPVVETLSRECTKEYKIPDSNITIEKGMVVLIPVSGLQNDPEYYPNPSKYDPDRFSPEEKAKRDHFLHIPFGEGPRICIGSRFGLLQTKIGLVSVLSKYNVDVSETTEIPVKMDPKGFTLSPLNGINLQISCRT